MVLINNISFKIYGIIGALFTLIIPFFVMFFNSGNHLETAKSLCPFKMFTGFPCPGCGITKSLVYFYEGNLQKSLSYHILGPFVVLFCIVVVLILGTELITKKEYFSKFIFNKRLIYTFLFFLIVYHLIRMIYFVKNNNFNQTLQSFFI